MRELANIQTKENEHLRVVKGFEDLLNGNAFAMMGQNTIVYENGENGFAIFNVIPSQNYSTNDFLKLPEGAPFELLNGKLVFMPSPLELHQNIVGNIFLSLGQYVKKNKIGILRMAPLDVHFDKRNIAQPDLLFVANERKNIVKDWVFGAPDLIVEVLSASTKKKDRTTKYKLYQKHGVREYWLVDPVASTVEVHVSELKKFRLKAKYEAGSLLQSDVVHGFELALSDIFDTSN